MLHGHWNMMTGNKICSDKVVQNVKIIFQHVL